MVDRNIDLMFITETWLLEHDDAIFKKCTPLSYMLILHDYPRGTGYGGIAIICEDSVNLCAKPLPLYIQTFEHASVTDRWSGFQDLSRNLMMKFITSFESAGLHQHARDATHHFGHTLAIVLAMAADGLLRECKVEENDLSDHFIVH